MNTLAELKEKNPEIFSQLMEEAKAAVTSELEAKFAQEKRELEEKFNKEKGDLKDRILGLEKNDAIRTERELRSRGESIWTSKLGESNIPEHLFNKVSAQISYAKFVKDGVLDEQKFMEAIDAEIKDWEEKGVTTSVLGMGSAQRTEEDTSTVEQNKKDDEMVDQLADLAGLKKEEK